VRFSFCDHTCLKEGLLAVYLLGVKEDIPSCLADSAFQTTSAHLTSVQFFMFNAATNSFTLLFDDKGFQRPSLTDQSIDYIDCFPMIEQTHTPAVVHGRGTGDGPP